jgi:hypothetical protein
VATALRGARSRAETKQDEAVVRLVLRGWGATRVTGPGTRLNTGAEAQDVHEHGSKSSGTACSADKRQRAASVLELGVIVAEVKRASMG